MVNVVNQNLKISGILIEVVVQCLVIKTCKNIYKSLYTFCGNQIQIMLQIVAL